MIRAFYDSALTLLCVVVPVAMLLGILWNLYDRECSWSLTILGRLSDRPVGVPPGNGQHVPGHLCEDRRRGLYRGAGGRGVPWPARRRKTAAGWELQILTAGADPLPVYLACGLSIVALAAALFSSAIAYYAMWALGHRGLCLSSVLHGQTTVTALPRRRSGAHAPDRLFFLC